MQPDNFMLDTNAYDYILDNQIDPNSVRRKGHLYITNVQTSEIMNVPNNARRLALLKLVDELQPTKLLLETGIWIDELRWDDDQPWIDEIGTVAQALIGNAKITPPWRDALMGEVAKSKDLVIITNDNDFRTKLQKEGVATFMPKDFFSGEFTRSIPPALL